MNQSTAPIALLATIALTALSGQAIADRGDLSGSLKFGQTLISDGTIQDANNIATINDADNDSAMGLSIGYEIDPNWTAEFTYTKGEGKNGLVDGSEINIENTSIDLYGVYRTPVQANQPYYFGKIGFGKSDVKVSRGSDSINKDDTGLVLGAGAGYQISDNLGLEVEYVRNSDFISFFLISARFKLNGH